MAPEVTEEACQRKYHLSFSLVLFFWPCGIWDLSYWTRDQTCVPCSVSVESQPLDHREVPHSCILKAEWDRGWEEGSRGDNEHPECAEG